MSRTLPVAELAAAYRDALTRGRPATVAEACGTVDGQLVRIAGHAAPGPDGLLTAPISGTPCVWYRSVTSPFTEKSGFAGGFKVDRATTPPVVPSSGYPPARMSPTHGLEIRSPDVGFAVVDGNARIQIDPAGAVIDTETVTVNEFRRDQQGRATALLQEWVIPPGQAVLAFGVPRGTSNTSVTALGPDRGGTLIVATHTEQYLRNRSNVALPNVKLIIVGAAMAAVVVVVVILLAVLGGL